MLKTPLRIKAAAGILMLFALTACELEPYEIPAEELYTRAFIQRFGLIDPNQNWNLAENVDVRINVKEKINSLKVLAEVEGKYYLVADYIDVEESVVIPVDVPACTKKIKVKADGREYYGEIGQTIDANGPTSRGIPDGGEWQSANGYTVEVSTTPYVNYNAQQMGPIIAERGDEWPDYWSVNDARWKRNTSHSHGLLPEKGVDDASGGWGNNVNGNRLQPGITQDFVIDPGDDGEITIYPMYWNTATRHELGIYLVDDNDVPLRDASNELIKFPVYVDKSLDDIQIFLRYDHRFSFDKTTMNLNVGDRDMFVPTPNIHLTWTSSNPSVATVNAYGRVTAVHSGSATITATAANGQSVSGTVNIQSIPATSATAYLAFGKDEIINVGELSEHIYGVNFPRFDFGHIGNDDSNKAVDQDKLDHFVSDFQTCLNNHKYEFLGTDESSLWHYSKFVRGTFTYTPQNGEITDISQYTITVTADASKCGEYGFEGAVTVTKTTPQSAPIRIPSIFSRDDSMPWQLEESNGVWTSIGVGDGQGSYGPGQYEAFTIEEPKLLRSRGYKIKINGHTGKVGMYISFTNWEDNVRCDRTFYSQKSLNQDPTALNPLEESYACSFKHPESQRIYFSFEDWINSTTKPNGDGTRVNQEYGWSDKDLNDLIFRLTGFSSINETGESSTITEEDPLEWIWAVEDLGATDDFDFNDVVVSITSVTTNYTNKDGNGNITQTSTKRVTFTPLAAGGILPLYLHWGNYVLRPGTYFETAELGNGPLLSTLLASSATTDSEYHRWFGQREGIINTQVYWAIAQSCTIFLNTAFTITGFGSAESIDGVNQSQTNKLFITVNGPNEPTGTDAINASQAALSTYKVQAPVPGTPPQMFIIMGNDWRWPSERTHINEAYPLFKDWVGNPSVKWYLNPKPNDATKNYTIGRN